MLDESGGVVTRTQDFEPGGQVFSRGEWLTIIRVNKSNGAVSSVTTPNYSFLGYSGTMKVTPDRITDYKAPSAEEAAVASQAAKRPPVVNYPGKVSGNDKGSGPPCPGTVRPCAVWQKQKTTGHTGTAAQWTIISAR